MSKKIKIFALVVLGLAGIIWAASHFGGSKTPAPTGPLSSSSQNPLGVPAGSTTPSASDSEFSNLLSSIKSIDIDVSIFNNPGYKALRDYPVVLGTDVVGRTNPFSPVGNDPAGSSSANLQVQTLQPGKVTGTTAQFGASATVPDNTIASAVVFEYGLSDVFGSATSPVSLSKTGTALFGVTGLTPGTTYYVRAILVRGAATVTGNTMTFITNPS